MLVIASAILLMLAGASALIGYVIIRQRRSQRELFELRRDLDDAKRYMRSAVAAREVPANVPHRIEPLTTDYEQAPFTGLTRTSWLEIATQLLAGALSHSAGLTKPLAFPTSFAAGYPGLSRHGRSGDPEAYLEAYARTLLLAAPILHNKPDLRINGRSVAEYYLDMLLRGVSAYESCSFGRGGAGVPAQRFIEAATIAFAIANCRTSLWDPLTRAEQTRVLRWLDEFSGMPVNPNNWRWFSIMLRTFLKMEGASFDAGAVRQHLAEIRKLYVDAGWFRDYDKFDFYSSWVFQVYPLFWANWDGGFDPAMRDELLACNDAFLESFPHVFSRDGFMPMWGRSISYRFGASASLGVAFLSRTPAIEPGFARRLCSGNLLQFIGHPDFLRAGIPSLGFYGERADLIDGYSCVASPFWCAKLFLALLLPEDNPFWTATEREGFWSDPPERYEFGRTGMWVEHNAVTGHSRLYAPQKLVTSDPRYAAPWFDTADTVYGNRRREVGAGALRAATATEMREAYSLVPPGAAY